ncbi:MAG: c-type cytochrome [Anaerolineales bacterium]
MIRALRYVVILVIAGVALIVLGGIVMGQQVDERLSMVYEFTVETVEIPADQASIERGQHLINTVLFCKECHGDDLSGKLQFNDPLTGRIAASNLTSGVGGFGREASDEEWALAIRHGIDENGKPLIEMPSESFYSLTDEDLGAIIAYLKGLPPVDNQLPGRRLGPFYQLSILSNPNLIPAEVIEHEAARPPAPDPGPTVEYGKYLATACRICHGPALSGGPGAGAGLDLRSGGNLSEWTEEDFVTALRTGETPRGEDLDPRLMPWERVGELTDDELQAIWLYLQTLQ